MGHAMVPPRHVTCCILPNPPNKVWELGAVMSTIAIVDTIETPVFMALLFLCENDCQVRVKKKGFL